jgi:hypothetical protein
MRIRIFAMAFLLTEGALIGYAVGKYDLDKKAANAIKAGAIEFIAFAKSVPPATRELVWDDEDLLTPENELHAKD